MTTIHVRDEGAIEPATAQIVVAAICSYFWAGVPGVVVPLGLLITLARVGSITGANTWRGRWQFGKKVIVASLIAAALGFFVRAGLYLLLVDGAMSFNLRLA